METYEQITLDQWVQWKEDIRRKLAETAQNFVHIGFRLKQIRDSGMFGGAADIFEFAEREYGLGKSTVSRFIAINEKYSEGGNSLELKEEYREFSSSKLSEMLTLPDNEIQLITARTTIREIRELKEFGRQGIPENTGEGKETSDNPSPFEKCILDFFRDKKEMLNGIMCLLGGDPPQYREAMERMNPSGQASHRKGTVFLFLYDWNTGIKYKLLGQPEPVSMKWTDFLEGIYHIYGDCVRDDVWMDFYGTPEPPVATSQQEDRVGKNSGTGDMTEKAAVRKAPEAKEGPLAAGVGEKEDPAGEEQIPGQMEVYDYPELIPEEKRRNSHGTEEREAAGREEPATDGGMGSCAGEAGGQGGDLQGYDEIPGTPEDDGCAGDPEKNVGEKTWGDVLHGLEAVKRSVLLCNHYYPELKTKQLKELYQAAINMAAAVEGMLIRSERNEQEHHA